VSGVLPRPGHSITRGVRFGFPRDCFAPYGFCSLETSSLKASTQTLLPTGLAELTQFGWRQTEGPIWVHRLSNQNWSSVYRAPWVCGPFSKEHLNILKVSGDKLLFTIFPSPLFVFGLLESSGLDDPKNGPAEGFQGGTPGEPGSSTPRTGAFKDSPFFPTNFLVPTTLKLTSNLLGLVQTHPAPPLRIVRGESCFFLHFFSPNSNTSDLTTQYQLLSHRSSVYPLNPIMEVSLRELSSPLGWCLLETPTLFP